MAEEAMDDAMDEEPAEDEPPLPELTSWQIWPVIC